MKSVWVLRCSCFIEINFTESENASDSLTIYCPTMVEPKTKGLNSYDPEYCLYNMNRLKPHPKYLERWESKELQRIITYSVLLRKWQIWWKAPFLAFQKSFVSHQYVRSQVLPTGGWSCFWGSTHSLLLLIDTSRIRVLYHFLSCLAYYFWDIDK